MAGLQALFGENPAAKSDLKRLYDPRLNAVQGLNQMAFSGAPAQGGWGEALARVFAGGLAGHMGRKMQNEQAGKEAQAAAAMENAMRLGQGWAPETKTYNDGTTIDWQGQEGSNDKMVQALMANTDTAPIGMSVQGALMDNKMATEAKLAELFAASQAKANEPITPYQREQLAVDRERISRMAPPRGMEYQTVVDPEGNQVQVLQPKVDKPKPMPSSALKMQNEAITQARALQGINADAAKLQEMLKGGKLEFGILPNLVNRAQNFVGASDEQSRNLASFDTALEQMRNAILLQHKGVQTEGDAQRAMNQLIQNRNDPELVAQRLQEIKSLNERAAAIKQMEADQVRMNYGYEPLELGAEPTPVYGQNNVSNAPAAPQAGTIQDGYRFKGGNPSDPKSWEKI